MNNIVFYINYLNILLIDLYNYIFPFTNVILINKSTFKITNLYFIYNIFYLVIKYLSTILFFFNLKKYINSFFVNYHVIYKSNSKFNLSKAFIIDMKRNKESKEIKSNFIESILFKFNNFEEIDMTNKIKKYSNKFTLFLFCLLNNINPSNIDEIIINIFNHNGIEQKILKAPNYLNKELEKLNV
jgi:hypothetical protein